MSYESGILYWQVPATTRITRVEAESGSGYAFGESQLVQTLLGYLTAYTKNGMVRGVYTDPDPDATVVLGMTLTVWVRPTRPAGHCMFAPGVPR